MSQIILPEGHLERRLGPWSATSLNMSNMIGVGPFITLPALMATLGGPQSMLGWLAALLITLPDALVWSELGAAMPASGGTYRWLRTGFGAEKWGRLMSFLFIWQLIISGPMEIGSGIIGFAQYLDYLIPGIAENNLRTWKGAAVVLAVVGIVTLLLYRRIGHIAKLTVAVWIGVIATVGAVIVTGLLKFDASRAFDFPPNAFDWSWGFMMGLFTGARIGIYDYLGYYDICYVGDEVRDPGRTIPRSVITSLLVVAALYVGINLSIIGIVPWREFTPMPGQPEPEFAKYVASICLERAWGRPVAIGFTIMLLWTAVACLFALLLGYSRIPYAAARDGTFFGWFGKLHPKGQFPHRSLLLLAGLSAACSFLSLGLVIETLVVLRILIQFIGQIAALVLLRRHQPDMPRPYRVWLYPLPIVIATAGWLAVFWTSEEKRWYALASLGVGMLSYLAWARGTRRWPFVSS
jgi:amino acid transporter